mmetsp:Transcript_14036/g.23227  ORF Transcript_14036/g.23227 Transcript_14036/m.23227 type:complete len:208 (-) Transcript_14036:129-752(-)
MWTGMVLSNNKPRRQFLQKKPPSAVVEMKLLEEHQTLGMTERPWTAHSNNSKLVVSNGVPFQPAVGRVRHLRLRSCSLSGSGSPMRRQCSLVAQGPGPPLKNVQGQDPNQKQRQTCAQKPKSLARLHPKVPIQTWHMRREPYLLNRPQSRMHRDSQQTTFLLINAQRLPGLSIRIQSLAPHRPQVAIGRIPPRQTGAEISYRTFLPI